MSVNKEIFHINMKVKITYWGKRMGNIITILKWLSQGSILLGGVLSIYWLQFTVEGKGFWREKINNMKNEEEQETWSPKKDKIIDKIKHGSLLLKLWLLLYTIFFACIFAMIFIALAK